MPEGPEVRKYADALDAVLTGRGLTSLEARTRDARQWLKENEKRLLGQTVEKVRSHGKHLLGFIEGGFYFHSHLMMWGRWQTFEGDPPTGRDRRERARIVVPTGGAILFSAPIFNLGEGDPYKQIENLATLGPDVIPYPNGRSRRPVFDRAEFLRRLRLPEHLEITIGAALLNQRILAGLGNYLRAEVLFSCRLNPWKKVGDLNDKELRCLARTVSELSMRSYTIGSTASDKYRERMRTEAGLVYQPGREYGTRHQVFRRTNLPCLHCGGPIKQLRQETHNAEVSQESARMVRGEDSVVKRNGEDVRTRIIYFCPRCQNVSP